LPSILQAYLELSSSPLRTSVEKPNFSLIQPQKYNESINKSVWASYGILSLVILLFLANFSLNLSDLLILLIGLIFLIFAGSQVSVLLKYLYQAKYQEQYQEYQDNFVSYQTKYRKLDSYNKVTERAWLRKELKVKKFRQQILKELLIEKVATISLESFYPREISRNDALLVQVGEKFLRLIQDIFGEKISQFISEHDQGISDAFNKGLKLTNGEIIGILNSDDWYEPETLKVVVSQLLENKNCDYCYKSKYISL
jgi:hypothetical protein